MSFISTTVIMVDEDKISIPQKMLKKLKIQKGDKLQITATENLIIIEKCEGEEE